VPGEGTYMAWHLVVTALDSEEFGEHRSALFIRVDRAIRLQHMGIANGLIIVLLARQVIAIAVGRLRQKIGMLLRCCSAG